MKTKFLLPLLIVPIICSCQRKVAISNDNVVLRNQQHDFILGTLEIDIDIEKVYKYPIKDVYLVIGRVEEKNGDRIKFRMDLINEGDTTYLGHTTEKGDFRISLHKREIVRFSEQTSQYKDLFIK